MTCKAVSPRFFFLRQRPTTRGSWRGDRRCGASGEQPAGDGLQENGLEQERPPGGGAAEEPFTLANHPRRLRRTDSCLTAAPKPTAYPTWRSLLTPTTRRKRRAEPYLLGRVVG